MENSTIVRFNFFDQPLVERVVSFQESDESLKTKENKKVLVDEIKQIYKDLDLKLNEEIKQQLVLAKENYIKNLASIEAEMTQGLEQAVEEHKDGLDSKEFKNVKFGLEIACNRAKIKEKNRYNEEIKELKLKRMFLHEEYTRLVYNVTGIVSPIESVRSKFLETKAVFNLKASLTNKKTWINLIP